MRKETNAPLICVPSRRDCLMSWRWVNPRKCKPCMNDRKDREVALESNGISDSLKHTLSGFPRRNIRQLTTRARGL